MKTIAWVMIVVMALFGMLPAVSAAPAAQPLSRVEAADFAAMDNGTCDGVQAGDDGGDLLMLVLEVAIPLLIAYWVVNNID